MVRRRGQEGGAQRRRRAAPSAAGGGFTLIELLVVIAIIGILAAMLFPVFAKAREMARRIQCLSGVKNIAMAINMYLADWERTWPNESDLRAINYFNTAPGYGGPEVEYPDICDVARQANPYLRDAVVLDDYVGNRELWQCPSARVMNGAAFIVPIGRDGYWLNNYIEHRGDFGAAVSWAKCCQVGGPCHYAFPPGWGGEVTDSFMQHREAEPQGMGGAAVAGNKVFIQGIGVNDRLHWQNQSAVHDPARYISCGDTGASQVIWQASGLAFPDWCRVSWWGGREYPAYCAADWVNCEWSRLCGFDADMWERFFAPDPPYQKTLTRHMGGSNVGFLDGHAKWFSATTIMTQSKPFRDAVFEGDLCACWPGNGMAPWAGGVP